MAKKIKAYSGRKRCPDGETYVFKNGVAKVPGFRFMGQPIYVTLKEFKEMSK